MQYVIVPLFFAVLTGVVGRRKGSSFFIWFLIGGLTPIIGLVAAIFYRNENEDPRRECPKCGKLMSIESQVCTRCGEDLDYPEELVIPRKYEGMEPVWEDDDGSATPASDGSATAANGRAHNPD